MKSTKWIPAPSVCVLFLAALCVAAPAALRAQEEQGPTQISVRLVDVKPDSTAEFETAITELAAAWDAAGRPFFHVYQRLRGPNLPAYAIYTLDDAFNELPAMEVDPGVFDRLNRSVNGSDLRTLTYFPELSIPSSSVVPSGEFMSVRVRTTTPSNAQAYFDWHVNELTPAARKGGVTDLRAGRFTLGGNETTFVRYYYGDTIQSAPAGGGNLAQTLGESEFQRLIAREASLVVSAEMYIYRFREDLSSTTAE